MDEPKPKPRHPEAPEPGTVDVSKMNSKEFKEYKKSLEDLYNTQIKDP
jgi:hypothetical protein